MAEDVFISYARKDREQVLPWVQYLQAAGVSLWLDETGTDGALSWRQEIVEAIEGCRVLLFMVSQASTASENVIREVTLASEEKKPVLPVFLEPATIPQVLRYSLVGVQHLELFHGDRVANFQAIMRSLTRNGVAPVYGEALETMSSREELRLGERQDLPAHGSVKALRPGNAHSRPIDRSAKFVLSKRGLITLGGFTAAVAALLIVTARPNSGRGSMPAPSSGQQQSQYRAALRQLWDLYDDSRLAFLSELANPVPSNPSDSAAYRDRQRLLDRLSELRPAPPEWPPEYQMSYEAMNDLISEHGKMVTSYYDTHNRKAQQRDSDRVQILDRRVRRLLKVER